jgi:hypothetical protein
MTDQATIPAVRRPIEGGSGTVTDMGDSILSVIARASTDPKVDVDKLERLLAMQERVLARDAEAAFNEALLAAQDEIRPIVKNRENPETHSKYADLMALADGLDPIMRKHGFSQSFGTTDCPIPDHYRVTCLMSHSAGHSRPYQADVPCDMTGPKGGQNKTRTHGFGSALSYGRRYLKLLIADVPTTDDDGRAAANRLTIDDAQVASIQNLASASGADLAKFCRYFKIESVPELPVSRFPEAVSRLSQKLTQTEPTP